MIEAEFIYSENGDDENTLNNSGKASVKSSYRTKSEQSIQLKKHHSTPMLKNSHEMLKRVDSIAEESNEEGSIIAVSYDGNLSSNMSEKLLSLDEKLIKMNRKEEKEANDDSFEDTDSFEMEGTGSLNSHRL